MSLVCHTIVSRYSPQKRDPVIHEVDAEVDPWQTESSFGPAQRLHSRPAPSFVPASLEYDEYGMPKAFTRLQIQQTQADRASQGVSAWYRSLTAQGRVKLEEQPSKVIPPPSPPVASTSRSSLNSSDDAPCSNSNAALPPQRPNWFASSRPPQFDATYVPKPSTLSDLLSRNPPPLPSEPAFNPPVFLTIGPSNRGFTMLQRKGWQEGEGLGGARVERRSREGLRMKRTLEAVFQERNARRTKPFSGPSEYVMTTPLDEVKQEVIDLTLSDSELNPVREVVDLTLSESDSEDEDGGDLVPEIPLPIPTPHGTTLLTPIATTLKADRLGIGLKVARRSRAAKVKAITHASAALAAHIRSGNQARKDKARHGRGSRGLARARRKEERKRVNMLAYMNS